MKKIGSLKQNDIGYLGGILISLPGEKMMGYELVMRISLFSSRGRSTLVALINSTRAKIVPLYYMINAQRGCRMVEC